MIGKTFAHYRIEEKLGQGGMGVVYRASDSKLGRQVALKVLPDAFAQDAERMARFQREAQLLASLNHSHIASIYGVEESDGVRALVLELIEGPTLAEKLTSGPIPIVEMLPIAHQIAQALEAAHESGVIHRDLKPENVKLTADGRVKVLDFGLAKAMDASAESGDFTQSPTMSPSLTSPAISGAMTADNVILGTAGYMSPEQARGQPVDKRSDIWAFGVIVYEMLVGRRLFAGETVSDALAAVLRLDPDWDALPPGTPARIRRLLHRCLERDPKQRLRDIGDARITVEETLAGAPDEEEAAVAVPDTRARAWIAAGGVLLAVAAFFAGSMLRPAAENLPLRKFILPVDDLSSATTVAVSPDGSRVAYTSRDALWIRDMDHLEPRALPGTRDAYNPAWSPDGEWIAYAASRRILKIRVSGGEPVILCEIPESVTEYGGTVWDLDGRIVFCTGDGPLLSVSAQGGDPDTLLPLAEGDDDFHNLGLLPEGRGLLFVVHERSGAFESVDVLGDAGRRTVVRHEGLPLSRPCYSPTGHVLYRRGTNTPGVWAVPFSLESLEATGAPFLAVPDGDHPSVGLDGTLVHSIGSVADESEILLVDRDGSNERIVGEAAVRRPDPSLSPDGTRVAVTIEAENRDLWIYDVERRTQTRLTFGEEDDSWPVWAPDGKRIYYNVGNSGATLRTVTKRVDGTGEIEEICRGALGSVGSDGRVCVYGRMDAEEDGDWNLWSVPLGEDGIPAGEPALFLGGDAIEFYPRISPDGRFVAYQSLESGKNEIYLKKFPGGEGKWQVSVSGGYWPHWSAAGDELFFASGRDILAVSIETDPVVRLGTPEVLFTRSGDTGILPFDWPDRFDVTADGRRFLIVRPVQREDDEGTVAGLIVAQNWYAEFARGG